MHKMTFSLQTLNAKVKGVNSSYLPENRHWDSHDLTPISRLWKNTQWEQKEKEKQDVNQHNKNQHDNSTSLGSDSAVKPL